MRLHFLLRYLNRLSLRRGNANPSGATTLSTSHRSISHEIPLITVSFPTFSSDTPQSSTSDADCVVCLSKLDNNDSIRILPACCHTFHTDCINTWLLYSLSCPLCRSTISVSNADIPNVLRSPPANSFRIEIGNIEIENDDNTESTRSFEYIVQTESSTGSFRYFVQTGSHRYQVYVPAR